MSTCSPFSFPESAFVLVSTRNMDSGHSQSKKSATHRLSALLGILRNFKQERSYFWLWPESVFLVLTKRKADSGDKYARN